MILVTGGAGFIGSNIVACLTERGLPVAVCDTLGEDAKWRNLAKADLCEIVSPDRLDAWLDSNRDTLETVIHMGAISATNAIDADLVIETNFRLSWFLWQWCARHGKRFLYASSAATYGSGEHGFDDDGSREGLAKFRPLNLYGWSKHLFDRRIARALSAGEPLPQQWAGLKFFNVYGPNEYHKGVMQSVIAHNYQPVADGHPIRLFKSYRPDCADGEQKRDFVFVADCVELILWLLDNPTVNGNYNVGTGVARSFADVARALFAAVGRPEQIDYIEMPLEMRARYQYFTEARVDRLRAAGFAREFTTIEQGIGLYVERYLSQPDPYR
ncbi:MAG TPA: ADP-glyceromanno-heptose 6-epimerase [Xanthomonadaceae bacterium]|nr:ADP-glyceromanno-heptose 6-epimerase [Xanthomonadaceae bacterium]